MTKNQIKYALEKRQLQLNKWKTINHFSSVGFCFIIPLTSIFFHIKGYFESTTKPIKSEEIWFFIIPSLIGIIFYFIQKRRLRFKEIKTSLNKAQLYKIIEKVADELEWKIYVKNSKIIIAKTHPSFFSGSWGEQITILFENKKVLVNSICDLDKKSSVVSMGRNKQNENTLIQEIKKSQFKI